MASTTAANPPAPTKDAAATAPPVQSNVAPAQGVYAPGMPMMVPPGAQPNVMFQSMPQPMQYYQVVPEEQPIFVNAKQYKRILKRREDRKKRSGDELHAAVIGKDKQKYQHESRHKHAARRPRGPGGRFLSREERNALKTT
mmetsp:Transcript_9370/g.16896  ORF Transcript_9370/g.16896 Transcript_9370/m.16896 type:complete len:141 (+) Transcript_9370:149-571(+)